MSDRAVRLSKDERSEIAHAVQEGDTSGLFIYLDGLLASRERAAAEKAWDEGQKFLVRKAEVTSPELVLAAAEFSTRFNPYRQEDRNG